MSVTAPYVRLKLLGMVRFCSCAPFRACHWLRAAPFRS